MNDIELTNFQVTGKLEEQTSQLSIHLADLLTPSVTKIIEFAKLIPGFSSVRPSSIKEYILFLTKLYSYNPQIRYVSYKDHVWKSSA